MLQQSLFSIRKLAFL
jgi:hypothetical protein